MTARALRIDLKQTVTSGPDAGHTSASDEITIAARAYELWQEPGCPIGSPETDWLRAEEQLKKQTAA